MGWPGWSKRSYEKPPLPEDFWNLTAERAAGLLSAGLDGLSDAEAASRARRYGPNDAAQIRRAPLWLQYIARFKNPLVLILLAASAVAAATGETTSFVIIAVVIILSVTLDFVQEVRAENAVDALRKSVAITARTRRRGEWIEIPAAALVPGDLVEIKAGDLIPADGLLTEARDLYITQAILTGEPYPAEKRAAPLPAPVTSPGGADNAGFLGTSVVSGVGHLLVCRTGRATMLGGLAKELGNRAPATAFEGGIRHFGLLIMRLTALLVLFVLLVNGLLGRPLLESFLFAVALAVGLTPELLPMVTTVTLSHGALRLARRRVIVKHLPALHNLGAMDLLCTDKTGTLTEAQVRVERAVDADGNPSARALTLAWINSHFCTGIRSPLDAAILASPCPSKPEDLVKLDEVPFDFERRCMSILAMARGSETTLFVKGAPENVLRRCSAVEAGDGSARPLDPALRTRLGETFDKLSAEGLRALAVAYRPMPAGHRAVTAADETDLVFVGFVAFIDPPKQEAAAIIRELAQARVAVKVLTGDNEHVTRHLCESLGLPMRGILTGEEVAKLTDEALFFRAAETDLFCRLSPQQKTRVVSSLRRAGHVVGFLGDGINDAPALHAADIGISVDSAADVAKEAADLILLEHDLEPVRAAVEEGRRSFENILKYILMGTSSNFGNMFSMAGATLFLPFLPMLPVQVLVNNLLYDFSELGIPFDRVDPVALTRPQRWDMRFVQRFMWVLGPVSSLFDFLTFFLLLHLFGAGEALFQTGWFVESMLTQTMVVLLIRTRGNPFANPPDPVLAATVFAAAAIALALPFTPLGGWLGMVALPAPLLAAIAGLAAVYFLAVETVKRFLWRRLALSEPRPRRF
ncbi:MAG TPA: magnesium-translocating P-type ATPase [Hypericibacter adhaerens]|uniref:magnesium-translocating P-type ATPase n=1 Tax=Hypericibacter adhaerens TaxID=2602016 RepID=UPI002C2CB000|nr:magnesium-translocating P-type ATPase [Hypericibacter adhaerens]HWA44685.1 magnesium-translocating P-type ATPase [Hypericibacter adhaerens]